jgi:hypothetical protein
MVFRGDYALQDADTWAGSLAANAENAFGAVGIADSQDRVAIGGGAVTEP